MAQSLVTGLSKNVFENQGDEQLHFPQQTPQRHRYKKLSALTKPVRWLCKKIFGRYRDSFTLRLDNATSSIFFLKLYFWALHLPLEVKKALRNHPLTSFSEHQTSRSIKVDSWPAKVSLQRVREETCFFSSRNRMRATVRSVLGIRFEGTFPSSCVSLSIEDCFLSPLQRFFSR